MFNGSEESYIILQNTLLTGINNISFKSTVQERTVRLLGNRGITRKINKPQETTCSFSKPYNGADFIQYLTGVTDLSGQFIYGESAIDFTNAAISSYSLDLNEEGLGEISVQMKIYGKMTPTTSLRLSQASGDFQVLNQTPKLQLFNLNNTASAVKSLNFQSSFDLRSSDGVGTIGEPNVKIISPVKHKISANIEMLEQEVEDVTGMVEVSSLTKNILAVFAPDENVSNLNRILEIQSGVEQIKSSGTYIDDLDFDIGSCSYNHFQFPESSLSSQELKSNAGEIVQLGKNYSAYSARSSPRALLNEPGQLPSCDDHLQQIEENYAIALFRFDDTDYANAIHFEDRLTGETDLNLWFREQSQREAKTGEDFEFKNVGSYVTNMHSYVDSYFRNQIDFENASVGETGLVQITSPLQSFDFEEFATGETGLGGQLGPIFQLLDFETAAVGETGLTQLITDDFFNETHFEASAIGETGLIQLTGFLDNQFDFEAFAIGETGLTQLITDDFFNETHFEASAIGETGLAQLTIDDFFNEVDFESELSGEIDTNLNNL